MQQFNVPNISPQRARPAMSAADNNDQRVLGAIPKNMYINCEKKKACQAKMCSDKNNVEINEDQSIIIKAQKICEKKSWMKVIGMIQRTNHLRKNHQWLTLQKRNKKVPKRCKVDRAKLNGRDYWECKKKTPQNMQVTYYLLYTSQHPRKKLLKNILVKKCWMKRLK
ncbi:uncharacterized protein [Anoplolepis gracilipes]|uniref:uncharacterized protein isoform X1 n=1 Tax=Anoplolepis gracilipes TaxID=354296 RepID=UPI003BA1D7E9